MKYVMYSRTETPNFVLPGLLHKEKIIDLEILLKRLDYKTKDIVTLRNFIELGVSTIKADAEIENILNELPASDFIPRKQAKLHAPLPDTRKLILLAGNYIEHIREVGYKIPPEPSAVTPQFFMKPPSTTIIGPETPIQLPQNSIWFDWEVELALIIGKRGRDISEKNAMDHVFGYTIINDISERKFNSDKADRFVREKDPLFDWLHGKWFDGSAPMGPCITTKEEIPDPHNLSLSLHHNGILQQEGTTEDMIHTVPYLIHKLSQIMTLEPGDVISTGTPSGVGFSKGIKLQPGDELSCYIENIGTLRNTIQV